MVTQTQAQTHRQNAEERAMRGEWVRWVLGLLLAAAVAYATTESEIARLKATQESQFSEVLRRMELMQSDIREIRNRDR